MPRLFVRDEPPGPLEADRGMPATPRPEISDRLGANAATAADVMLGGGAPAAAASNNGVTGGVQGFDLAGIDLTTIGIIILVLYFLR